MRTFAIALLASGAALGVGLPVASAQSLAISGTNVVLEQATTVNGVPPKGAFAAMSGHPKTNALLAKANEVLRGTFKPDPSSGFTTTVRCRFERPNQTVSLTAEMSFVPLVGTPGKPGTSAALVVYRYNDAPDLAFPRLLIQEYPKEWSPCEYSLRRDGKVTGMAAKHGDCVFRSALKTLEQMQPGAHTSLRKVMDAEAKAGKPFIQLLRRVYDERTGSVGQKNLDLATMLYVAGNWEEEFDGGYVDGAIDKIKPAKKDSKAVAEIKKLTKSLMKDVLKKLKDKLGKALGGLNPF